jgi:hypothetical protein
MLNVFIKVSAAGRSGRKLARPPTAGRMARSYVARDSVECGFLPLRSRLRHGIDFRDSTGTQNVADGWTIDYVEIAELQ